MELMRQVTARLDGTQEMAIESARQAAKAHEMADSDYKAVLNERNLDSKVANLTSRFQCGQLEKRFAELSAR